MHHADLGQLHGGTYATLQNAGWHAMRMPAIRILLALSAAAFAWNRGAAWDHGAGRPVPDTTCTITTGACTGVGAGSGLFTSATCNGNGTTDDAAAFRSFNTWAVGTWQVAHPGLLMQLNIPNGAICQFISGNANNNQLEAGLSRFQLVGYGATLNDVNGTGGGFAFGNGGIFFDNLHSARFATSSVGATSITLLNTANCSLFSNGNWVLLAGIDPQGFGDPPNPQVYEYAQINSTVSCAGSGVITLQAATRNAYKQTWPLYNAGGSFNSDLGGPATVYALNQGWNTNQSYWGIAIDQRAAQTNANGRTMAFHDITVPGASPFCVIPSQNSSWSITNGTLSCSGGMEVDKIVENVTLTNITINQIKLQSGQDPQNFTCNSCTISTTLNGTAGITTLSGGSLAGLNLGATSYGVSGAFTATNTTISQMQFGGAGLNNISTRGTWASGNFTVPPNMNVTSAASNGGLIRLTVTSSAGWSTGQVGDGPGGNCSGTYAVTVINSTTVDLQGSTFAGTCTGGFGSLPLTWAVPRANVYFSSSQAPLGPILQVADLAVGANNATVVSFNQNGSPYAGGFPTMPGSTWTITAHPAPAWTCTGCTGAINITDVTGAGPAGLPIGSYVSRVLVSGNNDAHPYMPVFGQLTELDITVSAACGGASNAGLESPMVITTLNSATTGTWNPTVNAAISSGTPRVITPTTSSGAQTGDVLTTPGANTWLVNGQSSPLYSAVGNCGSASTTFTFKTNQGVVYP